MYHHDGKCHRCGIPTGATIMSMFNTDILCMGCHGREREHPDFAKARDAEHEAVKAGNTDFPGVGLPPGYAGWAQRSPGEA